MHISRRQACSFLSAALTLPALASWPLHAVSAPRRPGSETFLAAVRAGDLERVRAMLGEDVGLAQVHDEAGRSAYLLAFVHGHEEVARAIAGTGLELDLVESVLAEDWERVEALAQARPELLRAAHPCGGTPLYAAALVGSHGGWRLRGLGCLPDDAPTGGSGFTPARGALEGGHASWARIALTDLCSNGGDVNARQREGSSVLHGAVARRDELLVRLAIRKGADTTARDAGGRTPAALAAELGWDAGVRLLAAEATLPRDDRSSRFALDANREPIRRPDLSDVPRSLQSQVTGSSHANLGRVQELVGTDKRLVYSISTDDELAIEASAHMGARPIMRYHLDQGAPLSLPTAVSLGDFEAVAFWLERDPNLIHERGAHDFPVLWYAALGGGSAAMAEHLVHFGVPLNQESMGTTTLHWAVRRGDRELAHWLLEQGADPEPVGFCWSREGETPLQVALGREDATMAALLRAGGAGR